MLISSLPPAHQPDALRQIIEHPLIGAVRYNTGMSSAYKPQEVVKRIQTLAKPLSKPVYIDLKAKQLRIIEWANLPDGPIVLNHTVKIELPAKAFFRGDEDAGCNIIEVVDGNKLFVDPLPKSPVGRGQAVNIVAKELKINGGLLPLDHEYIEAGIKYGVAGFCLSFVECHQDINELNGIIEKWKNRLNIYQNFEVILKIESRAGIQFVQNSKQTLAPYRLMAARDDLMIQIGLQAMPSALRAIIRCDPKSICASRLLLGLKDGNVSLADLSDLEYMRRLGYRNFMLSDGISREHFLGAVKFWENYIDSK